MAGRLQGLFVALVTVSAVASLGGKWAAAKVHHVVGGDRGWDPASDISSWAAGRIFKIGDEIYFVGRGPVVEGAGFTYSAAQGMIAELKSKEEYESCDLSNPIKMYTDGLHAIPLEREGIRYFVSTEPDHCKNGLKMHVDVQPIEYTYYSPPIPISIQKVEAEAPITPSGSARLGGSSTLMLGLAMLCLAWAWPISP